MKQILTHKTSVFGCFFILIILGGCVKNEIANLDSQGKNIICFGDSLTFGYGVNPDEAYPSILARLVDRPVINAGVNGNTSAQGLVRIKNDVLAKEPFLVIIEFGGNDFLSKIPTSQTASNIEKMIKIIQEGKAIAAVVDISSGPFLSEYKSLYRQICRRQKAIFIPDVF